ncbi:MAG: heme exporter protein CcmB [Acidobacteria bacterium]|nr:heme exporter protein CcmB [Acidobacteriota bacterium]
MSAGRTPRAGGAARAAAALLAADLRRELRTGEALVPMLMFAMIVLVVAGVTFNLPELGPDDRRRLAPGILWTAIAFAMLVGQARALLVDRDEERWQGLLLSPLDRTVLFGVKWLEGLLLGVAVEVLLIPLTIVFFDLPPGIRWGEFGLALLAGTGGLAALGTLLGLAVEMLLIPLTIVFFDLPPGIRWGEFGLALLAGTGGLAALGTLLGSLTTSLGRGEAMLSILVLPIASPILIAGSMTTARLLAGGALSDAAPWPAVLLATLGLNLALGAILFESVLVE